MPFRFSPGTLIYCMILNNLIAATSGSVSLSTGYRGPSYSNVYASDDIQSVLPCNVPSCSGGVEMENNSAKPVVLISIIKRPNDDDF